METSFITPLEPTVFGKQESYELGPMDHFMAISVETVHVVPEIIDIDRLKEALSRTLSFYPLGAGRLQKSTSPCLPWKIRLTNSGVPITFVDSDAISVYPTDAIIQRPLLHVQPVNVRNLAKGSPEEPLLRFLITRFTLICQTSIGMSAAHSIGDGPAVVGFLRLLSQYYQGLDPLEHPPSYGPLPSFEPPSARELEDIGEVPTLENPHSIDSVPPPITDTNGAPPVLTTLRLTAAQIKEIHEGIMQDFTLYNKKNSWLSRQDTITALIAHTISQADLASPPIHCIVNIVNQRGMGLFSENCSCNALLWAWTQPFYLSSDTSPKESIIATAEKIRASLTHIREINRLKAQTYKTGTALLQNAFNEMENTFAPQPGFLNMNSTWKLGWRSAHFGFPGQVKFHHTTKSAPRFLKVFAPNPTLQHDGKTWKSRSGDAEIVLSVFQDMRERFERILKENASGLGMTGDIEFIS